MKYQEILHNFALEAWHSNHASDYSYVLTLGDEVIMLLLIATML